MSDDRETLREELRHGDVASCDSAMSKLLDTPDPYRLDPADLMLSLDAMERLGKPAQSRMFQSFIEFASRHPAQGAEALVRRLAAGPTTWAGRLSASVLAEILAYGNPKSVLALRGVAVPALAAAVGEAARNDPADGREALAALAAWAAHEDVSEPARAVENWLRAASDAGDYTIRQALAILAAAPERLISVAAHAATLPEDHPLRRVLHQTGLG